MKKSFRARVNEYLSDLPKQLMNKQGNNKVLSTLTFSALAVVAVVMTVLNLIMHKGTLTLATALFAVLCGINILLVQFAGKVGHTISDVLFAIEILTLFSYFLISGSLDGFSAIWICLLPTADMFYWDRKRGSIVSLVMLVIMIVVLWTPLLGAMGITVYAYNATFKMRFPILFMVFHVVSFLLESLRSYSYNELSRLNKLHQDLSTRDQLTKVYNREGLYTEIRRRAENKIYRKAGVIIMDIDFFKQVNDTYGHTAGDVVLQEFAKIIVENLNGVVCRWGGEEFAVVYYDNDVKWSDLEALRAEIERHVFVVDENNTSIMMTISMGVFESTNDDLNSFGEWIKRADEALYRAKAEGRNRVIYY